jgi:sensor histidine kinase regulating citrate/malate metabolism
LTDRARLTVPIWHSLQTRVTVFALAVFVLSIWSLSFYLSRSLQADMERLLGEQQFSVVTAVAKEINDNLVDRQQALENIAKQMDADMQLRVVGLPPVPAHPRFTQAHQGWARLL